MQPLGKWTQGQDWGAVVFCVLGTDLDVLLPWTENSHKGIDMKLVVVSLRNEVAPTTEPASHKSLQYCTGTETGTSARLPAGSTDYG